MNRRNFLHSGACLSLASALGANSWVSGAKAPASDSGPLRLNANENALGLSPRALEAAGAALAEGHRYPFGGVSQLRDRLAKDHKMQPENLLVGNGSSELLRLVVSLFDRTDALVVTADPTYEAVAGHASARGLRVARVPLQRRSFAHDLAAMREKADEHEGPVLVYICNPNNPTGTVTPLADLHRWIESASSRMTFLVDEAYHHYAESPTYQTLVERAARSDNLLVTRTFSKIYAMAGLRLGYLVGTPKSVEKVARLTRLNVSNVAVAAALASLDDREFVTRSTQLNREGKAILCRTLEELHLVYLVSKTNFVMFEVPGELEEFRRQMEDRRVFVGRSFPPMKRYCRVSIGLPSEMTRFSSLLKDFRRRGRV